MEEVRALRLLCPADTARPEEVCLLWNHVRAHASRLARVGMVGCGVAPPSGVLLSWLPSHSSLSTGMLSRTWTVLTPMALPGCAPSRSLRQGCPWVSSHEVGLVGEEPKACTSFCHEQGACLVLPPDASPVSPCDWEETSAFLQETRAGIFLLKSVAGAGLISVFCHHVLMVLPCVVPCATGGFVAPSSVHSSQQGPDALSLLMSVCKAVDLALS